MNPDAAEAFWREFIGYWKLQGVLPLYLLLSKSDLLVVNPLNYGWSSVSHIVLISRLLVSSVRQLRYHGLPLSTPADHDVCWP